MQTWSLLSTTSLALQVLKPAAHLLQLGRGPAYGGGVAPVRDRAQDREWGAGVQLRTPHLHVLGQTLPPQRPKVQQQLVLKLHIFEGLGVFRQGRTAFDVRAWVKFRVLCFETAAVEVRETLHQLLQLRAALPQPFLIDDSCVPSRCVVALLDLRQDFLQKLPGEAAALPWQRRFEGLVAPPLHVFPHLPHEPFHAPFQLRNGVQTALNLSLQTVILLPRPCQRLIDHCSECVVTGLAATFSDPRKQAQLIAGHRLVHHKQFCAEVAVEPFVRLGMVCEYGQHAISERGPEFVQQTRQWLKCPADLLLELIGKQQVGEVDSGA
mmetsp:Transcript_79441/g.133034  ORF Transcript_79441/g.133034 Transcript_79441/m.133034 type:complete len:323 (-) Transcript_79441:1729-2697(-)